MHLLYKVSILHLLILIIYTKTLTNTVTKKGNQLGGGNSRATITSEGEILTSHKMNRGVRLYKTKELKKEIAHNMCTISIKSISIHIY